MLINQEMETNKSGCLFIYFPNNNCQNCVRMVLLNTERIILCYLFEITVSFVLLFTVVMFDNHFQLGAENILLRGLKWSKLLDPDKKGQWWLSVELDSTKENVEEVAGMIDKEVLETQTMLQLAAKQRMNTDARRGIFCIIMSGEDYIDAFEKLLRLDLPGKQVTSVDYILYFFLLLFSIFF